MSLQRISRRLISPCLSASSIHARAITTKETSSPNPPHAHPSGPSAPEPKLKDDWKFVDSQMEEKTMNHLLDKQQHTDHSDHHQLSETRYREEFDRMKRAEKEREAEIERQELSAGGTVDSRAPEVSPTGTNDDDYFKY